MKKALIAFLLILTTAITGKAQEQKYYIYNIFELSQSSKNIKVRIDDGNKIEELKDANGKTIRFKTVAGTLMYLISLGWDFYTSQDKISGGMFNGIGATDTTTRWIMRKPATREEFDKAVKDAIKN